VNSINYAKRIQTATISTAAEVRNMFPESFVYYRPKNIVSGDWYRVAQVGEYRILVVADCTGHGVPGAMLSMLGISALKDILADISKSNQMPQPAEILNGMRKQIIESLAKNDDNYHGDDGMDVAILVFTTDPTKAIYAGAKQDLILVRDGVAQRIKGDSMPIGRYIKVKDFSQTEVELQKGDMLYLFSDGIKDQFGPTGKFLIRRQTEFFETYATHPVDEQLATITKLITDWRADVEQTDDQTMIGVRVVE
jgi:serine phosphatase RsbU (regulator of sigma subunit)